MTIARLLLKYNAPLVAGQSVDSSTPRTPRMPEIATQFNERRAEFDAIAREWTDRYAHGDIPFGRWTRDNHTQFPAWMRRIVEIWLLIWRRKRSEFCDTPRDVAMLICSFLCTADAHESGPKLGIDLADVYK
jgi:hypothetical protein